MARLNLLAVSVGNTRTRIGAFVDGTLTESAIYENSSRDRLHDSIDHAFTPLREQDDTLVVMSSVNPPMDANILASLQQLTRRDVLRVERDVVIPIGRRLDREALVGEDRLLNAAAAFDTLQQAVAVIDAGTAMTIDFVDGEGTFHGGVILPGAQLMLDSLTTRSPLLPDVLFDRPAEPIGHNTTEAMQAGVFHGMRGAVREVVERIAEQVGAFPLVIATGGDANLLFRDYELIDRVVPDLTLRGLSVTMRVALDQNESKG